MIHVRSMEVLPQNMLLSREACLRKVGERVLENKDFVLKMTRTGPKEACMPCFTACYIAVCLFTPLWLTHLVHGGVPWSF